VKPHPDHAHWQGGNAVDRLFIITVAVKGFDGALGMIGGVILATLKPSTLNAIILMLTTHELWRRHDFIARMLENGAAVLSVSRLDFAAGYLLVHGAMKTFLAVALLIGRPWAYPVGSAFLGLFMAYTAYRLSYRWSWLLLGFLFLDLFTLVVVIREWRSKRATFAEAT
jgi:uncharacterized membrane protein